MGKDKISRLQVGVITQTHGIRGEVKVFPTTDDAARFKKLKEVILESAKESRTMVIEGVKFFKQYVILKFKDYDSINEIEKYKGAKLFVTREDAVKLKKDEYFIADLLGMRVVTEDGEPFGVLKDVLATGANDVYVVKMPDEKEALLPAIKECVRKIDMEKEEITVHIMDGLLS
ncbi:MAG: ribosome maturation factor RimM [Bacillus sp. (in: Bacteria)]|nr:ribosome maturation factor RimM [Bacillus sp. (in: firmicutes)]MCM1427057.1 ribosome maturation factor RimM [Eubacterium sp.]